MRMVNYLTQSLVVDRDRIARSSGACRAPVLTNRRTIQEMDRGYGKQSFRTGSAT